MAEGPPLDSMTQPFPVPWYYLNEKAWCQSALLALFPVILAATLIEKPGTHMTLPDEDSYRSPLSENLIESNNWRIPQKEKQTWRHPPSPPAGWRTPPSSQPNTTSSKRTIELFPRYQPGNPSDFDLRELEEKPLIKIFEFGSR